MTPDRTWRFAVAVQSTGSQAALYGARLLLTYIVLSLGADPMYIGIQASCFAAAGLALALPSARLSDRFGGGIVAGAGLVVALLGIAVTAAVPTLQALLAVAFLLGAGHVVIVVGQQSLVARVADVNDRDAAFGALSATIAFGQLIGPPLVTSLGGWFAHPGAEINAEVGLLVCCIGICLALAATFLLRRRDWPLSSPAQPAETARILTTVRIPGMWRALVVSGTVLVAVDLLASFLPLWAQERDIAPAVVGWLLALRALFTIVSRMGMIRLIAWLGRRVLLTAVIVIAAVAIGLLPLLGLWGAVVAMCLVGVGLGLPQPLTMSWVTTLAPPHARSVALATRLMVHRLSQVTIPVVVTALAGPFGVSAVLWTTAGVLAVSAGFAAGSQSLRRSENDDPPGPPIGE